MAEITEILTVADFNGDIAVGQKGSPEVQEALKWYFVNYIPRFFRLVFGAGVARVFEGEFERGDSRAASLVAALRLACARYVWCEWTLGRSSFSTGVGEVWLLGENCERADYSAKYARNWNAMADDLWSHAAEIRAYMRDKWPGDASGTVASGRYAPTVFYNRQWWGCDQAFGGLGGYTTTLI